MISIIIPIYNAEKFIDRAINSILKQSYTDWELILVDDGSKDNSYNICIGYAETDQRIRIMKQENQGANKARQHGWQIARGEWITFVDADDYLPSDALNNLVSEIDCNTDIIIGWLNTLEIKYKSLSIEEYRKKNIGRNGIHVGPVAHLYRSTIFNNEVFNIPRDIIMGEDMIMNIRLSFRTEKDIKVVQKIVYNYFIENPNNTTSSFKLNLSYEELLHKYRLLSIPETLQNRYIKELIDIRLYSLLRYIDDNPFNISWRKTYFFKGLYNDILRTKYTTNKSTRIILSTQSNIIIYLMILYRKIVRFLYK